MNLPASPARDVQRHAGMEHPTDYQMIKSAEIKNFRCFKSASISDCKTLNVVLGRNASGKTALLEALFLTLGTTPEIAQRFRLWRGLASLVTQDLSADMFIWGDLFRDMDMSLAPYIKIEGTGTSERSLRITYDKKAGFTTLTNVGPATVMTSPLKFHYKKPSGESIVRAHPVGQQWVYSGYDTAGNDVVFFPANAVPDSNELVDRFSRLVTSRRTAPLIRAINEEFPFITNIEIVTRFNTSALFLDIKGTSETMSAGLVSGGVQKIINLLTAISVFNGGVILIDEIENGIYYERYASLWRTIYKFAKENSVQIFTSTHSKECLDALAEVATDWEKDVSFIRTVADGNERVIEQFHGSTIFGAMQAGEIR